MSGEILPGISGQERVIRIFGHVLERGFLAHAYLLLGPSGEAKALALSIAKLLLCESPDLKGDIPRPCGSCRGCTKFEHQVHPDLEVLEPRGAMIKIDQIRDLQKTLAFAPLEALRRICLIFEAQKINPSAANAFLKTLEEPPMGTHLILTAPSVEVLLPTIVSRCQVIHCSHLRSGALMEIIRKEGLCPPGPDWFLTCLSEGSVSRAKDLLEQDVLSTREKLFQFLEMKKEMAIPMLFVLSKEMSGDRESALIVVQVIRTVLRDLIMLKGRSRGGGKEGSKDCLAQTVINPDYQDLLEKLSYLFGLQSLVEYGQWLDRAEWMLGRNVSKEFLLESALIFWIRKRRKKRAPRSQLSG